MTLKELQEIKTLVIKMKLKYGAKEVVKISAFKLVTTINLN